MRFNLKSTFGAWMLSILSYQAFAFAPLPSQFDYNSYLKWIQNHQYRELPLLFGFNPGVTTEYKSTDLAINVVCNLPSGCKNFVFWPFSSSEISLFSYDQTQSKLNSTRLAAVSADQSNAMQNAINRIYIPELDQDFTANDSSQIIGAQGLGNWTAFKQVNYGDTIMVLYVDAKKLQSSSLKLLFGQNSEKQFATTPAPLKSDINLVNGTTWSLISRQGLGPAYNNDPVKIDYTYSVSNGISSTKSFSLALTLGVNASANLYVMNAAVSRTLGKVWGQSVSITESSTSSLSAHCTNVSPDHSKVCPIYELMATTAIYAPGLQEEIEQINQDESITPAVNWIIGESQQTADGKAVGVTYPIGGVFSNGISITQGADYLVPIAQKETDIFSDRCEKKITNESNQPWTVSGKEKRLGDPKYEFQNCAPFSPKGVCIVLPKTTVIYSGRFVLHQGILTVEDHQKNSFEFSEKGQLYLTVCPKIHDVDMLSPSFKINYPTEGDLVILKDTIL